MDWRVLAAAVLLLAPSLSLSGPDSDDPVDPDLHADRPANIEGWPVPPSTPTK